MSNQHVITSMTLDEYLKLPYKTSVYLDHWGDEVCYMAYHDELPGCKAQGATWQEAVASLDEATRDYIGALLEEGDEVPLPEALNTPTPSWHLVSGPNYSGNPIATPHLAMK